jgi:tetratricopeptide (TPR) repeat protein
MRYDAGSYSWRRRLATWHMENERYEEASLMFLEANEIDPFSSQLHASWGECLEELGSHEEALREYEVAGIVPIELDLDAGSELTDVGRADLLGRRARCLIRLGRLEEAAALISEGTELQVESETLEEATRILQEARG